MSPPGAVISENFCIKFGCEAGVPWVGIGCETGAGTTAGPARRAGEAGVGAPTAGDETPTPTFAAVVPGDCTGVLALPTFVRAIVLAGCAIAAPLALACHTIFISVFFPAEIFLYFICFKNLHCKALKFNTEYVFKTDKILHEALATV